MSEKADLMTQLLESPEKFQELVAAAENLLKKEGKTYASVPQLDGYEVSMRAISTETARNQQTTLHIFNVDNPDITHSITINADKTDPNFVLWLRDIAQMISSTGMTIRGNFDPEKAFGHEMSEDA